MLCSYLALLLVPVGLFAADPDLKIGEGEAKKAAVVKVAPVYPDMAKQLKISGAVELAAVVAANGTVEEVRVVSGNPVLTKPAADALKMWKFTPFLADGKPARALVSIGFDFHM